jgi:hypothetical protein
MSEEWAQMLTLNVSEVFSQKWCEDALWFLGLFLKANKSVKKISSNHHPSPISFSVSYQFQQAFPLDITQRTYISSC